MFQKNLALLFLFIICTFASAQERSSMEFAETELNFGTVRAIDGLINHDFYFTNSGKVPVILNDVKSSCGCTVSEWTKEPVLPGMKGKISVSFNPAGQSGAISKSVQVVSNAVNSPKVLLIKGVVIPAERMEEVYKFTVGDLRLETIYASFGEIYKGKTANYTIRVINNSNVNPTTITFGKLPAHLKILTRPATLSPQQEGIIEVEYNSALVNTWDYTVDRIEMIINGKAAQGSRLNITATVKEDFSSLTAAELEKAPRAEFSSREHNFGSITEDQTVEHTFILKNTGKSNMYIRKVTASCGCTAVQPSKTTVVPGDSTAIRAVFNARGREGNQKKAITVITNDPKQSRVIVWINAVVEKANNPKPNPDER